MNVNHKAIAITGMACRFPGGCDTPEKYWEFLRAGADLVTRVNDDRWSRDYYHHPDARATGKTYTASAGQLQDVYHFDPDFFGISPREAAQMDPQQRLLLQMSWEALERAGQPPCRLAGSDCSVFVGISSLDYANNRMDDPNVADAYFMTGNTLSIAANRISYVYDLHGPSMAIDTACSSSLVALHQACSSIWSGESPASIVGAVHLILSPFPFIGFSKASMLSRDGRCRVFDAGADGYVRSEGGVVLVLKPLDQALADGDPVHAVIRGTAVNSDGNKSALTVPNGRAQVALLERIYRKAGIDTADIDYIEAHGTGTPVGDPIEADAIGRAIGAGRPASRPVLIGSVKSNVGHLEPASGFAGLLKVVLSLKHRIIPATIHQQSPNPQIDFAGHNLKVVDACIELPPADNLPGQAPADDLSGQAARDRPLIMGVNSFGFGGTNAHTILAEHRAPAAAAGDDLPDRLPPLLLSAMNETSLKSRARQFHDLLQAPLTRRDAYDIFQTAARKRQRLKHAIVVHGDSLDAIRAALAEFAAGARPFNVLRPEPPQAGGLAFVFSGNGSQWRGMGRGLLGQPAFRRMLEDIDRSFEPLAGWSLREALGADEATVGLEYTEVAQPLLFALQLGIVALLEELGVRPDAVIGHSVGEIAGAYAAGALTLGEAVRVIYHRSSAQARTKGQGKMAAVRLPPGDMRPILDGYGGEIELAAINSPHSVTVSGDRGAVDSLIDYLQGQAISCRELDIDYAFHSRAMDKLEEYIRAKLGDVVPLADRVTYASTVSGGILRGTALDGAYWWRNIREPVLFGPAVEALLDQGVSRFIEIGPHPVLQSYIREVLQDRPVPAGYIKTLKRSEPDEPAAVRTAGYRLLFGGDDAGLGKVFPVAGRTVDLPPYPWDNDRYIFTGSNEAINKVRRHPLLGYRQNAVDGVWNNQIDAQLFPYLADHVVDGVTVFPAAGFVEMALAAAREYFNRDGAILSGLEIRKPLILEPDKTRVTQLCLTPRDQRFVIRSRDRLSDGPWTDHVFGRYLTSVTPAPEVVNPVDVAGPGLEIIGRPDIYRAAALSGLTYGEAFQGVTQVCARNGRLYAELALPAGTGGQQPYLVHPVLTDAAFHTLFVRIGVHGGGGTYLPVEMDEILYYGASDAVSRSETVIHAATLSSVRASFRYFDAVGRTVMEIRDCIFRRLPGQASSRRVPACYRYKQIPKNLIQAGGYTPLPAIPALRDNLRLLPELDELVAREKLLNEQIMPLFDALASAIAERTFRGLGAHLGHFSVESLLTASQISREYRPYLTYLLGVLEQDGKAARQHHRWKMLDTGEAEDPADIWRSILADYPEYVETLKETATLGFKVLEHLDADGGIPAAGDPASGVPAGGLSPLQERLLRRVLELILADWPIRQRRLRIAEIRNAESRPLNRLLPMLPADSCDYDILALDEVSAVQAEEDCREFANVAVTRCDLSQGVIQQKYREGGYDIVLLADGLHRARSLTAIASQASHLLAAGGWLLLVESRPDRITDINRGLADPLWWHRTTEGGDPQSSRLQPDDWLYLLDSTGFEDAVNLMDELDPGLHHYLLAARRPPRQAIEPQKDIEPQAGCLLVAGGSGLSLELARQMRSDLERDGIQATLAAAPGAMAAGEAVPADFLAPGELDRFNGRLRSHETQPLKVVYLAGLDEACAGEDTLAALGSRVSDGNMRLVNFLKAVTQPDKPDKPSIWIVTTGATAAAPGPIHAGMAGLWGIGRVARNEYPDLDCRLVDLQPGATPKQQSRWLCQELIAADGEEEIVLTEIGRSALRLTAADAAGQDEGRSGTGDPAMLHRLGFTRAGSVDSLAWTRRPRRAPSADEVEIQVRATGLNFRDIMYTSGFLPEEMLEGGFAGASLGLECAGVVTAVGVDVDEFVPGDAVVALAPACFASHVLTPRCMVMKKPDAWSFETAATVPTAFFTVYYALDYLARLRRGERVLIHGAAGGVGLAAIQYAHYRGAEIFATAGTPEKRAFLELLGVDHVFDSRSLDFADQILEITGGEGVDVVLNSLAGQAMARNFRILRPFGRFLELGKRDFYENTALDLKPFRNNITYHGIDADQLMARAPVLSQALMGEVMALFNEGVFRPLPYTVFPAAETISAFRHMQHSRHIGKVVVSAGAQEPVVHGETAGGDITLDADGTYLVTGGLGGFGLATAAWLAEKGARRLVLVGRNGVPSAEAMDVIEALRQRQVDVRPVSCDVTDGIRLQAVLHDIEATGHPLKGVVHAAMVLEDGLLRNMDADAMHKVIAPKVQGAWNLHRLTQALDLDFFILHSSATTCIGNPGQGNYVAANAYLEALARFRRQAGLPATAVSWDAISDTGYLVRNERLAGRINKRLGLAGISSAQALDVLGQLLAAGQVETVVLNPNWAALKRALPILNAHLYKNIMHGVAVIDSLEGEDLLDTLAGLPDGERQPLVVNFLINEIARILQTPEEKIAHNCTIQDLGVDSLMAMELATTIETKLGINLPVMTLADNVTLDNLAHRIITMLEPGAAGGGRGAAVDEIVTSLARIHAEDLSPEELESISREIDDQAGKGRRLIQ